MNPMDYVKDRIMQLITDNLLYIAMGVAAIAGLAMLLGLLKKLAAATLTASLNAGDAAARKIAEKPRGVAVGLAAFALAIGGLWAWHTFTAPKIIEKPVIQTVTVRDETADAAIAEARGKYGEAESARSDAEAKAASVKAKADALETRLAAAEQARKQAETQAASLATQLRELSPPEGDETALERLKTQIDHMHAEVVTGELRLLAEAEANAATELKPDVFMGYDRYGREIWRQVPDRNPQAAQAAYRKYRSYSHKYFSSFDGSLSTRETFYHRSCSLCDHNCRIWQKMDEIYPRLAAAAKQRKADDAARKQAEREERRAEARRQAEAEKKRQADRDKRYFAENGGR